MIARISMALIALAVVFAMPALAQHRKVPYWASIDTTELNMRVGPSKEYRILWVYKRKGLPIKVIRAIEGWRLVRDHEGTEGWVSETLLSPVRGAIVIGNGLAAIRERPSHNSRLRWNAEPGVVGRLNECEAGWCEIDVGGRVGWMQASRLWGSGKP